MNVLVAVASRHGSTWEIGRVIAGNLAEHDIHASLLYVDEVAGLAGYDAVIVGSAVYRGHWLKSALKFVEHHSAELAMRPVWLFSSGPIADRPVHNAVNVDKIVELVRPHGHRIFAGKIDVNKLSFSERAMVFGLHAPVGDYRDWGEITSWSRSIAEDLLFSRVTA